MFAVAAEENRLDEFFEATQAVLQTLEENGDLGKLMNHPKIAKEDKVKIVEESFGSVAPKEIVGLMALLVAKAHENEMLSVFRYFIDLVKEEKKIGQAHVTTAVTLKEEQKDKIQKRLLATTDYETFEMHYHVDQSLIGGMVIRIGDRVVDSSIKTKLYDLSRELRNIQV